MPQAFRPSDTLTVARVRLSEGPPVMVGALTIDGDSLVGVILHSSPPGHPLKRFAVPIDPASPVQVRAIEVRNPAGPFSLIALWLVEGALGAYLLVF